MVGLLFKFGWIFCELFLSSRSLYFFGEKKNGLEFFWTVWNWDHSRTTVKCKCGHFRSVPPDRPFVFYWKKKGYLIFWVILGNIDRTGWFRTVAPVFRWENWQDSLYSSCFVVAVRILINSGQNFNKQHSVLHARRFFFIQVNLWEMV